MVQIYLIGGIYAVFQLLVPVLLFDYSSVLGVFWIVLFFLYTGVLVLLTAWLFHRREIRYLEGMYGTDFVLDAFPKERKRRERKAVKLARKVEKQAVKTERQAVKYTRKAEREAQKARDRRDAGLI